MVNWFQTNRKTSSWSFTSGYSAHVKLYKALENPALLKALAHPLRAKMLSVLKEQEASPKELAEHFGVPLTNVAYHIQVLRKLKLIRLVKTARRRGAVEHYYRADATAHIYDEAWAQTPGVIKARMVASVLEDVGDAVTQAAASGGFDGPKAHLSQTRRVLDEQAWEVLAARLMDVLDLLDQLEEESKARLRRADHEGERRLSLVMMLFEAMPPVPEPDAARSSGAPENEVATARRTKAVTS
jgi:DNA-binding transcriptional ArsR family regulator